MKKFIKLISLLLAMLMLVSCSGNNKKNDSTDDEDIKSMDLFLSEDDIRSLFESKLVSIITKPEVSDETYIDFVADNLGERLTTNELTSDIRVPGALMHHVSTYNSTTIIFLKFRESDVDDFYNYYSSDTFGYDGYYSYTYRGDGYYIISTSPSSYMIGRDNYLISIASYDPADSELTTELMGLPSTGDIYDILSFLNGDD